MTKATCFVCVDAEGKPNCQCEVRSTCYDDVTSTEQRKEILLEIPEPVN